MVAHTDWLVSHSHVMILIMLLDCMMGWMLIQCFHEHTFMAMKGVGRPVEGHPPSLGRH